ncbi:MAG: class I SAM-dependent methyltransferase [Actinobacteria bacterium]|nr:class I SAM-dependent methyltransferase [Actinomycetota bacterium]
MAEAGAVGGLAGNDGWSGRLEEALCFRCRLPGGELYGLGAHRVVRCPSCRQVFISPRLRADARVELYADASYFEGGIYGNGTHWSMAAALQRTWSAGRLGLMEDGVPGPVRGRTLLEVGCAYGWFLAAARERGYEVTGLEYSAPAAVRAAELLGVDIHVGELGEAGLAEGAFDAVAFWDVIEHVSDPLAFLREVRRVVRPAGIAAFSCPYFDSVPARLFRSRWWALKPTEHIWHFTSRTLRSVFEDAGFRIRVLRRNPLLRANLGRLDSIVGIAVPV